MNNAIKNSGLHGGSDAYGRGAATADLAPGKRTLTESLEPSPTVQRKAAPNAAPALSAAAVADSFGSSGSELAGQVGGSLPTVQRKSAADVAEGGFAGGGH